ncbi:putative reverse transcriptase zinc-binding domain-containing protein [Helianthus anomalus]
MDQLFKWSRIAVPKVNYFVWRALANRIPTPETLQVRGLVFGDGWCPWCGLISETADQPDHILASCVLSKSVWRQVCV